MFTFMLEIIDHIFLVKLLDVIRQVSLGDKCLGAFFTSKTNMKYTCSFMLTFFVLRLEGQMAVFVGTLVRLVGCMLDKKVSVSALECLSKGKQFFYSIFSSIYFFSLMKLRISIFFKANS